MCRAWVLADRWQRPRWLRPGRHGVPGRSAGLGLVLGRSSGPAPKASGIDRFNADDPRWTLVQIAGSAEMLLINMDTLLIEKDNIPNGGRCGVLEPESAEVELPFANAMHQRDS